METHVHGDKATNISEHFSKVGWIPSYSPDAPSSRSDEGNAGGVFLTHKPWLQHASPAEAQGRGGELLPDGDIAWEFFRVHGFVLAIVFAYFDSYIGFAGENLNKFRKIMAIEEGGENRKLVLCADFNFDPKL